MVSKAKQYIGFDDTKLMLIGIPIVSVMMNLLLFGDLVKDCAMLMFSGCQGISLLYTTFFWLTFRRVYVELVKRYGGYENIRVRYIIAIPLFIGVFLLLKVLLDIFVDPYLMQFLGNRQPEGLIESLSSFIFLALILSIYEGAHLFVELKESQLEKEQLVKANISSQLEGLKNQVNPHFLFNSLNTLVSIIPEDQDKSIRFVGKLSKVYRYILDIKDKKLVSLEEELKFVRSYTFLLEERFGSNIQVSISVSDDSMRKYIVPLSLQITFENAIKHNIISRQRPLQIEVFEKHNSYLVIRNNLQKKKTIGVSPGLGLLNIQNRYKFFTNKEVKVVEDDRYFSVYLPILNSQKIEI